jgi:hypothetical protein
MAKNEFYFFCKMLPGDGLNICKCFKQPELVRPIFAVHLTIASLKL